MQITQEYTFKPEEFRDMRFNPYSVPKGKTMLSHYKELSGVLVFQRLQDNTSYNGDAVMRYICFNYDIHSPIRQRINNEFRRKSYCGAVAGFPHDKENGMFEPLYHKIMNCEVNEVNDAITTFLGIFQDPEHAMLQVGMEVWFKKLRLVLQEVDDDKKNALEIEKTRGQVFKDVERMGDELIDKGVKYINERNTYMRDHLYRTIKESVFQRLNISPEERAKSKGIVSED